MNSRYRVCVTAVSGMPTIYSCPNLDYCKRVWDDNIIMIGPHYISRVQVYDKIHGDEVLIRDSRDGLVWNLENSDNEN